VKNQYFGDRRDLFKYDLLLDLVEAHGAGRLTFIPMLTPPDNSGQGRLSQSDCRNRRPVLYEFLQASVASGQRDIRRVREIMRIFGVDIMPFRDDVWFVPEQRADYFKALPSEYLTRSVVFFDPDIGLETGTASYTRSRGPEKYLFYSELKDVWARVSIDSVVVVYQHLQNDATKRVFDVERRVRDLRRCLGAPVWAVQWNDVAFVVVAREGVMAGEIRTALQRHAQRHTVAFCEVAA
jgi:hypothetical protein